MNIIDIFEKKTINQLNVLKNIYDNNGVVNIEKISKKALLDSKTINIVLQDILEQITSDMDLNKMTDYLAIRINIFQASWIYKLFHRLLLAKEVSIVSFTIETYISESKLRRKIKLINDMLKSVKLKIVSRNGYLDIKGEETQIRFLGQQFFWTIYRGVEWPFKELNFKKTYELFCNNIFVSENNRIKSITYVEWCYTFAINIIRFRHGKEVKINDLSEFSYLFSAEYMKKAHIKKIRNILTNDYNLSFEEQMYLFLLIQAKVQFYMNESFFEHSIQIHKKNKTAIYHIYEEILRLFMGSNINEDSQKIASAVILSANVSATLIHGFSHTHSGHGIPTFFTKYAPHLIPKMEEMVKSIQKKYPKISFLNQSSYLAVRYAEAYSLINNMMDFEKKVTVILMTDLTIAAEELMVRKLKAIFYMRANVEFMTLSKSPFEEYDLVIKTTVNVAEYKNYKKKIIIVSSDLCDKDIQIIDKKIKKIIEEKENNQKIRNKIVKN